MKRAHQATRAPTHHTVTTPKTCNKSHHRKRASTVHTGQWDHQAPKVVQVRVACEERMAEPACLVETDNRDNQAKWVHQAKEDATA